MRCVHRPGRATSVRPMALFGGGNRKKEREEMWKRQQEILAERRAGSGKSIKEAQERRQRVKDEIKAKEDKKRRWREALKKGEKFEEADGKEVYSAEDNELGIVIPLAPFGIPKFDNGERFDLRLPYVEEGWVDDKADSTNWIQKLFNKKEKKNDDDGQDKE